MREHLERKPVFAPLAAALLVLCAVAAAMAVAFEPHVASGLAPGQVVPAREGGYAIVYHLNGGTQPKGQMTELSAGETVKISSLKAPTRIGYVFKGWYANSRLTKKASAVKGVASKSKRTLYAKWLKRSYEVVYKLKGGTQAKGQVTKLGHGQTVKTTKLKKPKRSGYIFLGWYRNSKLTKKATSIKGAPSQSKRTVYAKWAQIKTLKIKYNLNDGKLYGSYVKEFKNTKAVKNLPTPVKSGYTFGGWCSNAKLTKPVSSIAKGTTKTPKLYAKWVPIIYSIAYVTDGGTLPDGSVRTYSADDSVETLPTPVRSGYSFMGWFSNAKLTKQVENIPKTSRGNKVLYAKWRERVLVAHRGLRSSSAPENSVAAFRAAAERGFREVEFDVRYTSDGVPVIVHDATVLIEHDLGETTVAVKTEVSSMTYEELQSARFAQRQSGEDGRNLATFDEAIQACSSLGLKATIHLKTSEIAGIQTLVDMVNGYGMTDRVRWGSSSFSALSYVKTCNPNANLSYAHTPNSTGAENVKQLAASGGDVELSAKHTAMTSSKVAYLKSAGIPARTWTFANERSLSGIDQYISTVLIDGLVADKMPQHVDYR